MGSELRTALWAVGGGLGAVATYKLLIQPGPHFSWEELDMNGAPLGARLAGVLLVNLGLEPLRRDAGGYPMSVNSGWRSEAKQDALIAAGLTTTKDSDHERGLAADIEIPELGEPSALMEFIYANRSRYPFRQVILEYLNGRQTHVHVALDLGNLLSPDPEFLYTLDRKNYPTWRPGMALV